MNELVVVLIFLGLLVLGGIREKKTKKVIREFDRVILKGDRNA